MSITLQSVSEAQSAAPRRRHAVREDSPLPAAVLEAAAVPEAAAEPAASAIAAGWYDDPLGRPTLRWWDGGAWTAELSGEAPAEPTGAAWPEIETAVESLDIQVPDTAPRSRRQLRELTGPLTTGSLTSRPLTSGPLTTGPIVVDAAAETSTPLVSAASLPRTVTVVQVPSVVPVTPLFVDQTQLAALTTVETPTTQNFSTGALGFTLPPDPFAAHSAAIQATPFSVVPWPSFATASIPAAPIPAASISAASIPAASIPAVAARSTTVSVWLLALLPAVHAALVWLVLARLDLGGNLVVRYAVLGAPLVLALLLAFADRRALRARGFSRTAPTVLALMPPIYLVVRIIRGGAAGILPLLVWLLLQAGAVAFVLLQLPTTFALLPLTPTGPLTPVAVASGPITVAQRTAQLSPSGMAAELTRQTLARNLHFSSITCPTIPVTVDGTAVTCGGTIASVKMHLTVMIDSSLPNSAFALVSEAPAG